MRISGMLDACDFAATTSDKQRSLRFATMASDGNWEESELNMENYEETLHSSDRPWKPYFNCEPHLQDTVRMSRQIRSILNRLTLGNYMVIVIRLQSATNVWDEDKMSLLANMLVERAISEPKFSSAYARVCKDLAVMKVTATNDPDQIEPFRKLILNRCQKEFQKDNHDVLVRVVQQEKSKTDIEEKMIKELEEAETKARHCSLSNIRFVGELFKLGMVTAGIMHKCLNKLISASDEDSLECLCHLLITIGKVLECRSPRNYDPDATEKMDNYIKVLTKIVQEKTIFPRVRFMLEDVCDLRKRYWVPLRHWEHVIAFTLMGDSNMNKHELRRRCYSVIDAYLHHLQLTDVVQTLITFCSVMTISYFLNVAINSVFMMVRFDRIRIGQLFRHLLEIKVVSVKQFTDELSVILSTRECIVWDYVGELISKTMIGGTVSFKALTDTLHLLIKSRSAINCITSIVHHLEKDTNKSKVREMWCDSSLNLSTFLGKHTRAPPELEFLIGTTYASSTSTWWDGFMWTRLIPLQTFDGFQLVNLKVLCVELTEYDANVPAVKSLLQKILNDDRDIILIDSLSNAILDTEETRGASFWSRCLNVFCIFEDDYSKYMANKNKRETDRISREIAASQHQVDDSVDMLQKLTSEIKVSKEAVTELVNYLPKRTLPMTNANIETIEKVLQCIVCEGFNMQPVIGSCCGSIISCKPCYDSWKIKHTTDNEIASPQPPCPKCGLTSGIHFEVFGLAEISSIFADLFEK